MMNSFFLLNIAFSLIIILIKRTYSVEVKQYAGEEDPKINVTIIPSVEVYRLWSEQEVKWESGYEAHGNRMFNLFKFQIIFTYSKNFNYTVLYIAEVEISIYEYDSTSDFDQFYPHKIWKFDKTVSF